MTRETSKAEAKPNPGGAMITAMRRFLADGSCSAAFEAITLIRDTAHYSVRPNPLFIQEIPNA